MLSDEEKQTIKYLKLRLYGNEGCKFIDVAQSDLRIFLKLVENLQKDIESWKKYCDEQENDITLKNNKICDLEFKIEKQSKEIEHQKKELAILNAKQIEFNKLKNTVNSYKGQFKRQQKEIELLKEENEKYKNPPFFDEDKYTENDKIKAKIEELEKLNDEATGTGYGFAIYYLQSLLEKE